MATSKIKVPVFDSVNKSYDMYCQEIDMWKIITKVDVKQRGVILAYELPLDDPSDIRSKLFNEVNLDDLNADNGLEVFITYMDKHFKTDDLTETYQRYIEFDRCERGVTEKDESIKNFVGRFDKLYTMAKKKGITLPNIVLAFKLLDAAKLSEFDRKCILLEMDFEKKDTLFEGVKKSLIKFKGKEVITTGVKQDTTCDAGIKIETQFCGQETSFFGTDNRYNKQGSGSGSRNGRGFKPGYSNRNYQQGSNYKKGYNRTKTNNNQKSGGRMTKPVNPKNSEGEYLTCVSCGSFRHMIEKCPHSWESLRKKEEQQGEGIYLGELEESLFVSSDNLRPRRKDDVLLSKLEMTDCIEDVLLYTSKNEEEVALLGIEASNSALLDCGCTSDVCGVDWMYSLLDCLNESSRKKVIVSPGTKTYRFGGGEVLKSKSVVTFPCIIAEHEYTLTCDVVDSKIPLLLSLNTMKKMEILLDLVNDRAKIFGKWIDVNRTTAGHYALDITSPDVRSEDVEVCFLTLENLSDEEKEKTLRKLHRQFGHPTKEKWQKFIANFKGWKEDYKGIIDKIYDKCKVCPQFRKSPPRPVVSMPVASNFNEVVTLDLKEYKVKDYRYILHMIDAYTRFTVSVLIKDKKSETISDAILRNWVGASYGVFKRMWTDVGGEFNAEEIKQLSDCLGIHIDTTAGYAAWMNGINERNHCVVDRCLEKIMLDWPDMSPEVALAWAVNAKNAMPMHGGFSSYQLVYGKNPNLPNIFNDKLPALEGTTTSETIAKHIQALHAANKSFQEVQCDSKIRKALAHKVRAVERMFQAGESVYFKRDGNNRWRGPATVIGNVGSVYFIKHQGSLLRLAACRLIGVVDAELQIGKRMESSRRDNVSATKACGKVVDGSDCRKKGLSENIGRQGEEIGNQEQPENSKNDAKTPAGIRVQKLDPRGIKPVKEGWPVQGDVVEYRKDDDSEVKTVTVSKTEKKWISKGWYNVTDGKDKYSINLDVIKDWRICNTSERTCKNNDAEAAVDVHIEVTTEKEGNVATGISEETRKEKNEKEEEELAYVALIPGQEHSSEECKVAKKKELENWTEFNVFTEVRDEGQEKLSHLWVISEKVEKGERMVKARLVVRGFEEVKVMQTDSPTGNKDSLRAALTITAMKRWRIKSLDVKSAYLQGEEIKREIYMDPPEEMKVEGMIWKLNKAVYGTMDGARVWYMKLDKVLKELGCTKSLVDPCLYLYRGEKFTKGFLLLHVDDITYAGDSYFENHVMRRICEVFKIGRHEADSFIYTGLNIGKTDGSITLDQVTYIESLVVPDVKDFCGSVKAMSLVKKEHTLFRKVVGQLNWIARQTRPDMCFDIMEMSMKLKEPIKNDLVRASKAMKAAKMDEVRIIFPGLISEVKIFTFSDAAFANLADSVSSGRGYVIFAVDVQHNSCPLAWQSNKVRRVVKSTMAAETLSLQECIEHACLLRRLLAELMFVEYKEIPIVSYVDSENLRKAVYSTKQVLDKKLRIDLACVKESIEKENVKVEWIPGDRMLANCLTKAGASARDLMRVLETGTLASFSDN